jgi:acetyl esterase/lipase
MLPFEKRIVHAVDAMAEVRVQRAISYAREAQELLLDVYALPGDQRRPVVFLVHGGPLSQDLPAPTSWGVFQSWAELLAASGLVACVFNHRLHELTDYQRSQADIADAIGHVRNNARDYRVDPEQVALWYFSGSGPQLSWLLRERPAYVRCAVALYALLDVRHLVPPDASSEFQASARALSPAALLRDSPSDLPLFVARAGLDRAMVNVGIDGFVDAALATNASLAFMNHPTGDHMFECTDGPRTREIITAAITFTRQHLGLEHGADGAARTG